jgi:hypothetical protein
MQVSDDVTMRALMTYNDWQHDPLVCLFFSLSFTF